MKAKSEKKNKKEKKKVVFEKEKAYNDLLNELKVMISKHLKKEVDNRWSLRKAKEQKT